MAAATPHSVRIPPSLFKAIKRLADADDRSFGGMITKLLREALVARGETVTDTNPDTDQETARG